MLFLLSASGRSRPSDPEGTELSLQPRGGAQQQLQSPVLSSAPDVTQALCISLLTKYDWEQDKKNRQLVRRHSETPNSGFLGAGGPQGAWFGFILTSCLLSVTRLHIELSSERYISWVCVFAHRVSVWEEGWWNGQQLSARLRWPLVPPARLGQTQWPRET